ncbi:sensor histidine kinase [Pararobbsia silviterrae]|uniref:histidine kinase n=1 Tax=Pararobbsia silviterrae TaxID=1792498 RepID=A0A494YAW4_9BURK|nr:sensor histidine kinase KdpD [Pararobbsia silviterrae]RKP57430.1 sensor histidine kinase KdpD [Pararobbsia silviterrae]
MNRPDPDALLDKLQRDEAKAQRGRLKIFFGASAGVGKTFAMLQAARRLFDDGMDVVVGIVETHGRAETQALLDGLQALPLQTIDYRGRALQEFDLDAALARRAQVVLVDELAHSNVAGARHAKRWQDVHELLDAGIDVFTTLNVQHLESLNDIVGQITGIRVWETVPDRVFDLADDVTLVDLPADDLLDRLREGKVYLPQQAERAVRNFFRKGNLIALRELALRRTADRVDAQMREYRADRSIDRVWQTRERVLVCIGPGPEASALVRAAARLATRLRADWIAAYVETPQLQRLPETLRERTLRALKLAQDLGAETATLDGDEAAASLVDYAHLRNVSKIVVGRTRTGPRWRVFQRPVGERIAKLAGDLDVTRIGVETPPAPDERAAARGASWRRWVGGRDDRSPARGYVGALATGALVTAIATPLANRLDLANLVVLYLLGVVFVAYRLGRGPGIVLSFLSVAAFDFFFVPPRMSLSVSDTQYLLTFAGMLITSLVISHLTSTLRGQVRIASLRERRSSAMYEIARELGAALMTEQIVEIGARHVSELFRARVAVLLPDSDEAVRQPLDNPSGPAMLANDAIDFDVAQWVYDQQKRAGRGTDTLPASHALYVPLKAPMRTRGVLAILCEDFGALDAPEQQRMLDACAAQIALALERVHYVDIARDALVDMESERLRNSLLSAISHDLRTPLTSLVGFASMLAQSRDRLDPAQAPLLDAIHDEAQRMTGLVTNLLDMARLQSGHVRLNREWTTIEEVVGAALRHSRHTLATHPVAVRVPADLPLVQIDAVLIERVFANLFENAAKYTPSGTPVTVSASVIDVDGKPTMRIDVDDDGPGLPAGAEVRIFDKFMRGEKESAKPGIGLGLAICRAIVEAHGGTIGAANRPRVDADGLPIDGTVSGARFSLMLPIGEPPLPPAPEADVDIDVDVDALDQGHAG